jgi:hypothetical protein
VFKLVIIILLLPLSEKDIDSSKMFLHEGFCAKNFKKCTCGEIIEIANEEEHIKSHSSGKVNNNTNVNVGVNVNVDDDEAYAKKLMEEDEMLNQAMYC